MRPRIAAGRNEIGKLVGMGMIAYIYRGWGLDISEPSDRESSFDVGFRRFF